jgi:hypothetical protein
VKRIADRVAAVLGAAGERWSVLERRSLLAFAPLIGQIPALESWAASDKRALVELLRLRAAPTEREFALRACAHDTLRHALAAAARGATWRCG